jgi:nitrogenase molybdenum-iron protein alpha/beta subunit
MKMQHDQENELKQLVAYHLCKEIEELNLYSDLACDYGMIGDDAWEFIEEFEEKFKVDLNHFVFEKHFAPEYTFPFEKRPQAYGGYPITVNHLIEVIKKGEWFEPKFDKISYDNEKKKKRKSDLYIIILVAIALGILLIFR